MSQDEHELAEDPRYRNRVFDVSNAATYVNDYVAAYADGMKAVSTDNLERAIDAIVAVLKNGNRVYAIGNGGSAAIADHLSCDFTKGTHVHNRPAICSLSLNSNVPLYTAIANDFGFEHVFSKQIEYFGQPGDVLIAISSSGNSQNIIEAVETAKNSGLTTIGLSGFSGGKLNEVSEISLYVPIENYGVVEDCHQALMHVIAQCIAARRDAGSE